jgi:hypothetical protein
MVGMAHLGKRMILELAEGPTESNLVLGCHLDPADQQEPVAVERVAKCPRALLVEVAVDREDTDRCTEGGREG